MKKIKFTMLAVMAALAGFVSCEKPLETPPEPEKAMEIDAEASYDVISTSPKDVTFNINSNTPWTISSSAEWCKPSPLSSDESSLVEEITVTFENNEEGTERTAEVTITGEGISKATVITFKQAKKSSLEIEQIAEAFTPEGGEKSFTVTSNEAWTVEANAEWLTFDKTSGEGTGQPETVKATAAQNDSAERKAVVKVTAGSLQKTFEAVQEGLFIRFVEVDATAKTFDRGHKTTKSFAFETNAAEVEVKADDPEAKVAINEGKVDVTLDLSSVFKTRKVKVTIFPKGKNPEDFEGNVLEVSQGVYWDAFSSNDGTLTFDATAGTAYFKSIADQKTVKINNKDTLIDSQQQTRILTSEWNTLGRYEFDIESIEVGEDFLITVVSDNRAPLVSWELQLGKNKATNAENTLELKAGGKCKKTDNKKNLVEKEVYPNVSGWTGVKIPFEFTSAEANAMKKLIVEFKENADDAKKVDILVQADEKVLIQKTVTNPYKHTGKNNKGKTYTYNHGGKVYFGFPGLSWDFKIMHGNSSMVLKSAKFTPLV